MKSLSNSAGVYLTGDDIADAVMAYGAALANEQRVDLIDIPYVRTDDHGSIGSVRLTVGSRIALTAHRHEKVAKSCAMRSFSASSIAA